MSNPFPFSEVHKLLLKAIEELGKVPGFDGEAQDFSARLEAIHTKLKTAIDAAEGLPLIDGKRPIDGEIMNSSIKDLLKLRDEVVAYLTYLSEGPKNA